MIVGCPTIALLVRSGRLQKWPKAYYESDADDTVRNGVFALLPFSAMFAVVLLGIALGSRGGAWEYATLVSLVAMLALLWLGLRWMKRPPAWLQPQWRLAAERGEGISGERPMTARSRGKLEVSRLQYWLGWAVVVVAAALGLWFGVTAAVPVGVGVGVTYLLSMRPRHTSGR